MKATTSSKQTVVEKEQPESKNKKGNKKTTEKKADANADSLIVSYELSAADAAGK